MGNISLLANRTQRVNINKCVLIKRTLEGPGTLNTVVGSQVFPNDIIGTSTITSGFSSLNLAKELNIKPQDGMKYIQRGIGQKFFKGELLALKKGIFGKKVMTAPTDCILENYDDKSGLIRLKYLPHTKPLISGVYGIIASVNVPYGEVLIKTIVTEIWGVLGTGHQRHGFLNVINKPGELTNASQISPQMKGQIIAGGGLFFGDSIKKAAEVGVEGIISAGVNLSDFVSMRGSVYLQKPTHSDIGIGLMVTEGFGAISMGNDIFQALLKHQGKFVILEAGAQALWLPSDKSDSILTASKIVLPVNGKVDFTQDKRVEEVQIGMGVRVIRKPFIGAQGKILAIDQTQTLLESGISTYLLTIETPSRKIKVPYTNIEII